MLILIVCNKKARNLQILPVATLRICYIAVKMLNIPTISGLPAEASGHEWRKHEEAAGVVFICLQVSLSFTCGWHCLHY